jgi:acyl-CoA synthetase (AMP-forming)/AMP-acid ligase II
VYPAEIEAVLAAHPAVAEAGMAGQDDARWGRVPVAFVTLRPGAPITPEELIAFCRERLARYKVPARPRRRRSPTQRRRQAAAAKACRVEDVFHVVERRPSTNRARAMVDATKTYHVRHLPWGCP